MDTATVRGVIATCAVILGVAVTPLVASAAVAIGDTTVATSPDTVTFVIGGEVTRLGGAGGTAPTGYIQVGDRFSVEYSFDRNAIDSSPEPEEGSYVGAVLSVEIAIGPHVGSGTTGDIGVGNGYNEVDFYTVSGQSMGMGMGDDLVLDFYSIGLNDESATAFDSDALPVDPRQLDGLTDFNLAHFSFSVPYYSEVEGRIDSRSNVNLNIEIEPSGDINDANLIQGNANVEVALLGSTDLNVADVDVSTLRFGASGTEATPIHNLDKKAIRKTHLKDVNGDGFTDLITHYRVGDTGLVPDDSVACLTASSLTGQSLQGCDSVQVKSNPAVGPPVSQPVGPPVGAPVGPPISPPAGPPMSPPVGPPVSPPVRPPISPPAGPPASPPVGPPISPPAEPPVSPPANRPVAPMFGGFVKGLGGSAGLIGTIVVALGVMLLTANGAASAMTVGTNRPIRGATTSRGSHLRLR